MLKSESLNKNDMEQYLKRLKMNGEISIDFNSLQKIQESHMLTIPFENIDIANNIPIKL